LEPESELRGELSGHTVGLHCALLNQSFSDSGRPAFARLHALSSPKSADSRPLGFISVRKDPHAEAFLKALATGPMSKNGIDNYYLYY
jgi:hypothetical protein